MTGSDGENRPGNGLVGDEVTRTTGAWLESWAPGLLAESSQRAVCITQCLRHFSPEKKIPSNLQSAQL